jgi:DNA-binding PadR family transcriptional regulator
VTQSLRSLERGGAVRSIRGHARNHRRRVKVYHLTLKGEGLVRHILDGMGR